MKEEEGSEASSPPQYVAPDVSAPAPDPPTLEMSPLPNAHHTFMIVDDYEVRRGAHSSPSVIDIKTAVGHQNRWITGNVPPTFKITECQGHLAVPTNGPPSEQFTKLVNYNVFVSPDGSRRMEDLHFVTCRRVGQPTRLEPVLPGEVATNLSYSTFIITP